MGVGIGIFLSGYLCIALIFYLLNFDIIHQANKYGEDLIFMLVFGYMSVSNEFLGVIRLLFLVLAIFLWLDCTSGADMADKVSDVPVGGTVMAGGA